MHMASLASPKDYLEHPIETLESGRPARATCWNSPPHKARVSW